MSTGLEIKLTDEQIDALADRIFQRMERSKTYNRPLTLTETAKRLGVSVATVSRRVSAGQIRTIEGVGCPRVSEEEIRRLMAG